MELLINFGSKSFHFKDSYSEMKSVKSLNPFKSVIQKSYDIVKSHGGSLKVESKEGEGSEFVIQLPVV